MRIYFICGLLVGMHYISTRLNFIILYHGCFKTNNVSTEL